MKRGRIFNPLFSDKTGLFFFGILLLGFISSCVSNKQAVYVQPGKEKKIDFEAVLKEPRKIKLGDELYIRVNSEREETNMFSEWDNNTMAQQNITLASYRVDKDGSIRFPLVGKIRVQGLSLEEAANVIEKSLIGIITRPIVTIHFVNNTVTVLGEVNAPGRYDFNEQKINIFQALGYAGDIAYFGNRKHVMLVREENGIIQRHYFDLTDENLLESDYFFVLPNDVIYVEPLKRRNWGFETFPWGITMGIISTTLVILTFINNQ